MVCGHRPSLKAAADRKGGWLFFAEYKPEETLHEFVAPGHPAGLEYACYEHIDAASALTAKTSAEAIAELRKRFPPKQATWWQRLFRALPRGK